MPGARRLRRAGRPRRRLQQHRPQRHQRDRAPATPRPTTLNSDQFWWRVRAVDLAGQPTPWTESLFGFQRQWPDKPAGGLPDRHDGRSRNDVHDREAVLPVDAGAARHVTTSSRCRSDANFSRRLPRSLQDGRHHVHAAQQQRLRLHSAAARLLAGATDRRAVPSRDGLPGLFSTQQAFQWTDPGTLGGAWDNQALVTGLKIAVDGSGIAIGAGRPRRQGCSDTCATACRARRSSWDPVPGATLPRLLRAGRELHHDRDPDRPSHDQHDVRARATDDSKRALPESQAGSAYYWYVRPCWADATAARRPGVTATAAARTPSRSARRRRPITGLSHQRPQRHRHHVQLAGLLRHQPGHRRGAARWATKPPRPTGSRSTTTRRSPRSSTRATVDQTTYTASDQLYPEGTYFWRVQATRRRGQRPDLVRRPDASPRPARPSCPLAGRRGPGAGNDPVPVGRPGVRRVVHGRGLQEQRPDLQRGEPGVQRHCEDDRVRADRPDPGRPTRRTCGASAAPTRPATRARGRRPQSFFSSGAAPSLLTPKAGIWLKNRGARVFEWTEVPGAASYMLNITGTRRSSVTTVATAYAPVAERDRRYAWSVTAYDGAGNPLATSADAPVQGRRHGAVHQEVRRPLDELKAESTIKATFSEKVKRHLGKSIKMYKAQGRRSGSRSRSRSRPSRREGRLHRPEGPPEARRLPDPLLHEA